MTLTICIIVGFIIGIVTGIKGTTAAYLNKAAEEIRKEANNIKKGK